MSRRTRQIASSLDMSKRSVRRIAKVDLNLAAFWHIPAQVLVASMKQKRLNHCKTLVYWQLLTRSAPCFWPMRKICIWILLLTIKTIVSGRVEECLLQREKFAKHVMVSARVCFSGEGKLHFAAEKAKVSAKCYVESLLPHLIHNCKRSLPTHFMFQQDGAPANTIKLAQEWIEENCPEFIKKDEWPPNSPDLNPLNYHVLDAMLELYQHYSPNQWLSKSLNTF